MAASSYRLAANRIDPSIRGIHSRLKGSSLFAIVMCSRASSIRPVARNFDAYRVAGGLGAFEEFLRAPGLNGHFLINDPELWESVMDGFLERL